MENQSFNNNISPSGSHIHESQLKAWEFPGKEVTKINKKNTQKGLIFKGEIGDSSSFYHA
jgi:hypothetical protein